MNYTIKHPRAVSVLGYKEFHTPPCQVTSFTRTIPIFLSFIRMRKSEKPKQNAYLPKIFCTACLMTVINSVRPVKEKHKSLVHILNSSAQVNKLKLVYKSKIRILPSPRRCCILDKYCCWTSGGARTVCMT